MTSEQPTSAVAIAKLEELGRQRRAAGKKAGTLKQESLDVWTELFVAAVTEDHGALGTVIAIPGLPPRVAAAGLAKLWPQLDQAARVRVLRLLPKDSDKGSPMRFSLASELMDIDPTTAAEQLADLPRSNEYVNRLGRLLREQPTLVAALVPACPTRRKGESLLLVLLGQARASETHLPARLEVIRVGLAWLRGEAAPDFGPETVGDSLADLIESVDPRARASFEPDLAAIPGLWVHVFPDRPITAPAPTQASPEFQAPASTGPSSSKRFDFRGKATCKGRRSPTRSWGPLSVLLRPFLRPRRDHSAPQPAPQLRGTSERTATAVVDIPGQLRQLDTWLNELEQHARILKAARALLGQAQRETSAVRSDLAEWKARASQLGDKVDEAERRLSEEQATTARLSAELEAASGRIQELESTTTALRAEVVTFESDRDQARAELDTERQAHRATREELLRRMEVATEARLMEFKNQARRRRFQGREPCASSDVRVVPRHAQGDSRPSP